MKITIDGTITGKIQLLSFKTYPKWLARMFYKSFDAPFHEEAELEFGTGSQTIEVPGPLDIIVSVDKTEKGYLISAALVEDRTKFVIFEVQEDVETSWSGDFETKIGSTRIKGTITVS